MDDQLPRPFAGQIRPDPPVYEEGPLAPWHATVKVLPLPMTREVKFQVFAEWTGPPALYMPEDPNPGLRQDVAVFDDLELARAVAILATEQLGRGKVPDFRAAAERFRARAAQG